MLMGFDLRVLRGELALRGTAFAAALLLLAAAVPAAAQTTTAGLSLRPMVLVDQQLFAAMETFKAVFGQSSQTLWGGGLNVTHNDRIYVEVSASQFKKTGERAFVNNGQAFRLGIPLTATVTPLEITGGLRFHPRGQRPPRFSARRPAPSRFVPYVGGGIGLYQYRETSGFSLPGEDVETRHAGAILEGGVEVRLHRWFGVAADVHYTHVPGILGAGGISKDEGEKDLGGIAGRFKVIVGR